MKIILSGGGTLGPVAPLIAIYETYKKHHPFCEFVWVGTRQGVEKELLKKAEMKYIALPAAKFRRYFSLWNILDIFRLAIAFFVARTLLKKEKPNLCISAGGFVSVPLHWAAASLNIPTWIHQQDVRPGLANKMMAWTADKITVATADGLAAMKKRKKITLFGNPSRYMAAADRDEAKKHFLIPPEAPTIFVTGGGTGAARLNDLIVDALPYLPKNWRIIHLIGSERAAAKEEALALVDPNYRFYKFFTDEMPLAYAAADLVVCRGGFGSLTELAALRKTAVIAPIWGSHQVDNVKPLVRAEAVAMINETKTDGKELACLLVDLMNNPAKRKQMGENLHHALPVASEEKIVEMIEELAKV